MMSKLYSFSMSSTVLSREERTLKTLMNVAEASVRVSKVRARRPLLRKVFRTESRNGRMESLRVNHRLGPESIWSIQFFPKRLLPMV